MKKNNEFDKKIKTKDKTIKAKDKNEKITKNELDIDYNKELNPNNLCSSIYAECLPIIMEKVKESVYKNIKKGGTGTVFYVKYHFQIHLLYYRHLLHVIIF